MSWDSDGEQRYGGWPPMQRRMGFGNTLAARLLLPCVCLFTRSWSLCTLNIRRTPCCHPDVIFLLSQCCKNLHETVEHLTVYALPLTISKSFWRALLVSRMDLSSSSTVFANWFFLRVSELIFFERQATWSLPSYIQCSRVGLPVTLNSQRVLIITTFC
jgi:hypothetical protein